MKVWYNSKIFMKFMNFFHSSFRPKRIRYLQTKIPVSSYQNVLTLFIQKFWHRKLYMKIMQFQFPLYVFLIQNVSITSDHILLAYDTPFVKHIGKVILCTTNNLYEDATEDVADGIVEIGRTFPFSSVIINGR